MIHFCCGHAMVELTLEPTTVSLQARVYQCPFCHRQIWVSEPMVVWQEKKENGKENESGKDAD